MTISTSHDSAIKDSAIDSRAIDGRAIDGRAIGGRAIQGYEPVHVPGHVARVRGETAMFRRRSVQPTRRAVLHVQAAGDPAVPPDLASWYTERAFHFYRGRPAAARPGAATAACTQPGAAAAAPPSRISTRPARTCARPTGLTR